MAVFQRFRLIFDRELADGPVNQINPATVDAQSVELVALDESIDPEYGAFISGPQNYFALSDDELRFAICRSANDDAIVAFTGDNVSAVVTANLAASNVRVTGSPLCRGFVDTLVGGALVRIHEPAVVINPTLAANFGTLPPWPVLADVALVPVGGRSGRGAFQIGAVVETPSGTLDVALAADNIRRALAVAASRTFIPNAVDPSEPFQLDECNLATLDAGGRLFVSPADLGAGPGLIDPTSLLGNTSQVYAQHPTTFVRRGANVRGVGGVDMYPQGWGDVADGNYPVTDYRGALMLYVVDERPLASVWRFWIDGAPVDVTIPHDPALDLRRPRDVWQALIAPELSRGSPFNEPAVGSQGTVPLGRAGAIGDALTLSVVLGTTRYVQAARCLGFVGANGPAMTYTPQVPGGGPRPPSLARVLGERTLAAASARKAAPSSAKSGKGAAESGKGAAESGKGAAESGKA